MDRRTNNVGEGIEVNGRLENTRLRDYSIIGLFNTLILNTKVERSLYHRYQVTTKMLKCLSALDTLIKSSGRQSVPEHMVIEFSGRARLFKANMYRSFAANLAAGNIEAVENRGRFTYRLSRRGEVIKNEFEDKFRFIEDLLTDQPSKRWTQGIRPKVA